MSTNNNQQHQQHGAGNANPHLGAVEPRVPYLKVFSMEAVGQFNGEVDRYRLEIHDWNRGRPANARVPMNSIKSMINTQALENVARYKLGKTKEEVTDEDLLNYFAQMKAEHVGKKRPDVNNVLKNIRMNLDITDPVGRNLDLFTQINEKLEREGLKFLWDSPDSCKTITQIVLKSVLPLPLSKAIKKEAVLKPETLKSEQEFFKVCEKFIVEHDQFQAFHPVTQVGNGNRATPTNSPNRMRPRDTTNPQQSSRSGPSGVSVKRPRTLMANDVKGKCFKCGSTDHSVKQCPAASVEEKARTFREWINKARPSQYPRWRVFALASGESSTHSCTLDFGTEEILLPMLLDSGADVSVAPVSLVDDLLRRNCKVVVSHQEVILSLISGEEIVSHRSLLVPRVVLAGRLIIRDVIFYLLDNLHEVILGKNALALVGLEPHILLRNLLDGHANIDDDRFDMDDEDVQQFKLNSGLQSELEHLKRRTKESLGLEFAHLYEMFDQLIEEFKDVFRVGLDGSPPILITPYKPVLKPGIWPTRAKTRRFSPNERSFLQDTVDNLLRCGLIRRNSAALWSSPVFLPPKGSSYRFTVDLRRVNNCIVPRSWPMPFLDAEAEKVASKKFYASLDADNGYFQIPTDPAFQDVFSILIGDHIYTPTCLLQGCIDGVAVFQSAMMEILGDLIRECVSVWIDDLVTYVDSPEMLCAELRKIFIQMRKFRVKINPKKTVLFCQEIEWCGKIISSKGVKPSSKVVQGLLDMNEPETVGALQQYVSACNWLREYIPNFTQKFEPLTSLLLTKTREYGTLKGSRLDKYALTLSEKEKECFSMSKEELINLTQKSYPQKEFSLALMTDASDLSWSVVLTQFPNEEFKLPVQERNHMPLAFLSGHFTGSELNWSVPEKELYPIIVALKKLKHFLQNEKGFSMFCDHRNLIFILDPEKEVSKNSSGRLQRWASLLFSFHYTIEHIAGENNLFPDLLSRWGAPKRKLRMASLSLKLPKGHVPVIETLVFPTIAEIKKAQIETIQETPSLLEEECISDDEIQQIYTMNGKIWIPTEELAIRIMVIAHCGTGGHRGYKSTAETIKARFLWKNMMDDIARFTENCFHCMIGHPARVPRPLGSAIHGQKPNEVLHFDYCQVYNFFILIIRDDLSGFVHLRFTNSADAYTVALSLLDWISNFGIPKVLVSDNGSHFKNKVISKLSEMMKVRHHFTLPYTPWSNGSIEIIVKDMKNTLKKVAHEFKLNKENWASILPLIQFALNHSVRVSKGYAPVEIMTGISPSSSLDAILAPITVNKDFCSPVTFEKLKSMVSELKESLENMHKDVHRRVENNREFMRKNPRNVLNLLCFQKEILYW
jgi:hypothetical protein